MWRDQQRQIDEMNRAITRLAEESRVADERWREEMQDLREESRLADERLGERINALVSAMGQFVAETPKPGKRR